MNPSESASRGIDRDLDNKLLSLMSEWAERHGYSEQFVDECLGDATYWIQHDWKRIKEVMEPMQKTSADDTEAAAKEAFKRVQVNQHYEFEISALAGYISSGILENIYKQAFFAGYNYRCSLEVKSENREGK